MFPVLSAEDPMRLKQATAPFKRTGIVFRVEIVHVLNAIHMANGIHKGTELHNISETWDENERKRAGSGDTPGIEDTSTDAATGNPIEQLIKEEASEYDSANKEDRLLSGERASV